MKTYLAHELVEDFDLYPRREVSSQNIHYLAAALKAGTKLPPVVIVAKSKRIIDGIHRRRAHIRVFGKKAEIECIEKPYRSEAATFRNAIRLNAEHGQRLSACDRAHCIMRGEELGVAVEELATDLHVTTDAIGKLRVERIGTLKADGRQVALKRTIAKMVVGKPLTKRQAEANERLSGMNQVFYVNQVIELFEADLIDWSDAALVASLKRLTQLLATKLRRAA